MLLMPLSLLVLRRTSYQASAHSYAVAHTYLYLPVTSVDMSFIWGYELGQYTHVLSYHIIPVLVGVFFVFFVTALGQGLVAA